MIIKPTQSSADFHDTMALQKRFMEAADKLSAMAGELAIAKQVKEFSHDRCKRALAVVAAPLIAAGASASAAETEARASALYASSMKQLSDQLTAAERTIAMFESTKIQWETARSLLSFQKDAIRNL